MKAAVERFADRIWLKTSAPTPGLATRIKGARWNQQGLIWTLPLRLDVCRMLREEFGSSMEIGPDLAQWAKHKVEQEAALSTLGSTLTAVPLDRIPVAYPAMAKALEARPYQSAAVNFVAKGRSVLLADQPGLGKTLEAIGGIIESAVPGPYLVCTPHVAMTEWRRQIERWVPDHSVHVASGSAVKRAEIVGRATGQTDWLIINTDMLRTVTWWVCRENHEQAARDFGIASERRATNRGKRPGEWDIREDWTVWWRASDKPKSAVVNCGHDLKRIRTVHQHVQWGLFAEPWGAVVIDECDSALIRLSGQPTQVRNGARLLPVRTDGLRIAASGTPTRGKAHQIWGTLNWLRPKEYTGFWAWAESYFSVTQTSQYGGLTVGSIRTDREGLLHKSLEGVMLRRTKAEVSPELPAKQYMGNPLDPRDPDSPIAVWLPMEPKQAAAYAQMQREGVAEIKGGQINTVGILAEMTRLRQFATAYGRLGRKSGKFKPALPSNKLNWLIQFCRELGIIDQGARRPTDPPPAKVVVVSRFTSVLRLFAEELMDLGVDVVGITGAVTGKRRDAAVDAFNSRSGPRVMFLNTKAGGVGITLDAADDMVFLDETDRPDDQTQAEARIDNRRPEEKVAQRRYWYLRSEGTIDEATAVANLSMDLEQHGMIDGRRGVAYAKAVFDYLSNRS